MNREGIIETDSREVPEEGTEIFDGPSARVKNFHMDRRDVQRPGDVSHQCSVRGGWGYLDVDAARQTRVDEQGDLKDVLPLSKRVLCDVSSIMTESPTQIGARMKTCGQWFLHQVPCEPWVVRESHAGDCGCHGHRLPPI